MPGSSSNSRGQRTPVRLFNGLAGLSERLGRKPDEWIEDEFLEAARKATGLDDFGSDTFREELSVLLDAYQRESRLSPFGRMMARGEVTGILKSRLGVVDAWKQQPEVLDAPIRRPIFVLGLPRTGTTALHDLLGCDPANQSLDYWLASAPGPRPPLDEVKRDPRYKRAKNFLRITYYLDPELRGIHNLTPDGPDECRHLLQESFTDDTFDSNASIPSYTEWYAQCDMRPSYEHHRDVLKLVQGPCPERRWSLKYPAHMTHLEILLETYPDACIVQTHRDPARVLPSLCSLVSRWRGIYEHSVDRMALGRWQLELWASRIEHAAAVRANSDPARFYDVRFDDFQNDPVATIAGIYEHFGFEFSAGAEEAMRAWQTAHPHGEHGIHQYDSEDFGLSTPEMSERFEPYIERFQLASREAD